MQVFLSSDRPLTDQLLHRVISALSVQVSEYRVASTFRAFLGFADVESAYSAMDELNSDKIHDRLQYEHIRALPMMLHKAEKLNVILLQNWHYGSLELHQLLRKLPGFTACYASSGEGLAFFNEFSCVTEFKRENGAFFLAKYEVVLETEEEERTCNFGLEHEPDVQARRIIFNNCGCFYERALRWVCCFESLDDANNAASELCTAGIPVEKRRYELERSCQIYNLKIGTEYQDIYEILNALSPVETLRLPDFLFVDENKFHVNVVFRASEGVERTRMWLGVVAADLVQEGKEAVVV